MGARPRNNHAQTKYTNEQNDEYHIILQKIEFGEILIDIIHQNTQSNQCYNGSDHAQFNVCPNKRSSDKRFRGPNHLHGFDDKPFGIYGQSYGTVDQQNSDYRKSGTGHQNPKTNFSSIIVEQGNQ